MAGRFIYNNYRQALERIATNTPQLNVLVQKLKLKQENDIEEYLEEERRYLEEVVREEEHDEVTISAEYVTLLESLDTAK